MNWYRHPITGVYLVNLLSKCFRLSDSSEVYRQQCIVATSIKISNTKLKYLDLHFIKEI